ncbi:MAG: hypothetical protein ACI9WC_001391 [Arenicella sp.]|jgi:hypothetical protein
MELHIYHYKEDLAKLKLILISHHIDHYVFRRCGKTVLAEYIYEHVNMPSEIGYKNISAPII